MLNRFAGAPGGGTKSIVINVQRRRSHSRAAGVIVGDRSAPLKISIAMGSHASGRALLRTATGGPSAAAVDPTAREVPHPGRCVDEGSSGSVGDPLHKSSGTPSQPTPSSPSRSSRLNGDPTNRRKGAAAALRWSDQIPRPRRQDSSSMSMLVRDAYTNSTCAVCRHGRAGTSLQQRSRRPQFPTPRRECRSPHPAADRLAADPARYHQRLTRSRLLRLLNKVINRWVERVVERRNRA